MKYFFVYNKFFFEKDEWFYPHNYPYGCGFIGTVRGDKDGDGNLSLATGRELFSDGDGIGNLYMHYNRKIAGDYYHFS